MQPKTSDSRDDADSLKPLVASLLAKIDKLLAQNEALLARIAELGARPDSSGDWHFTAR